MLERIYCRICRMSVILLLAAVLASSPVQESTAKEPGAENDDIWKSDVKYYRDTDTYFQLIDDKQTNNDGPNWSQAATAASQKRYKGRKGRLAIIDDPKLQNWIIKNFNLPARVGNYGGETWIGLRFLCSSRELWTVTGERYARTAFSFWDVPWHRSRVRCETQNMSYMPLYISGKTSRWQACGSSKHFPHYLVEYPAK